MRKRIKGQRMNATVARAIWGELPRVLLNELKSLTQRYALSIPLGDIQFLNHKWYVTHAGLLRLAQRRRCAGIAVRQVERFCDPVSNHWIFKATVYKNAGSRGFVGYGDADPSNVSPLVRGAEMRVAETRAVNRALRKAYGIGLCSVEELGSFSSSSPSLSRIEPLPSKSNGSSPCADRGSNNGQPRLRDRLCLLIRQHHLDASLVKSYAAEYCGTATLREASREMVEAFITHLGEWAGKDREGLLAKLQSYTQSKLEEVSA